MNRRSSLILLATLSALLPPLPSPVAAQWQNWSPPVTNYRLSCGYFDRDYLRTEGRQHLGLDLAVTIPIVRNRRTSVNVTSPVRGRVIRNWTDRTVDQSVLIIKDENGRFDHVLGHIRSSLRVGEPVGRGQVVGTAKLWITPKGEDNTHVHWGVNQHGINFAEKRATSRADLIALGAGTWGWGRAPRDATLRNAHNRGWMDLLKYVRGRPNCQ